MDLVVAEVGGGDGGDNRDSAVLSGRMVVGGSSDLRGRLSGAVGDGGDKPGDEGGVG